MRKILSFICLAASLSANAQNNNVVVNGKIDGLKEGQKVYLDFIIDKKQVSVDSAVVKDGTFTLKSKCNNKVDMGRVTFEIDSRKGGITFFPEPGTVSIELVKGEQTIKGTPTNDAYNSINHLEMDTYRSVNKVYMESRKKGLSDEERKKLTDEVSRLTKQTQVKMDSAKMANISNLAGIYFINRSAYNKKCEELKSLYDKIPAKLKSRTMVKDLKATIDKMEKTSIGKPFIDFEMADMDGKKLKFSSIIKDSKVTLLDFWASWCGPCCAEMPNVVKAYNAYKAKGFNVVSVSLDNNKEKWLNAVKKFQMEWQQLSDLNAWNNTAAQLYGVQAIPTTLLLDEKGIIIAKDLRGEELTKKLEEILGK